jgi:nitrogen-specific signal transduction histidine kinase
MAVFVLLTLLVFYRSYKAASTWKEKIQSKYLMVAISVPGLMGILILLITQPLGFSHLNMSVAALSSVIMSAIFSYAIVKHRLMDIELVLKKTTVHILTFTTVIVPGMAMVLIGEYLILERISYLHSIYTLLIIIIACILFYRIRPFTEKVIEKTIFKDRFSYRSILVNFSREIVTIVNLQVLSREVIQTITTAMGIDNACMFIHDKDTTRYELQAQESPGEEDASGSVVSFLPTDDALIHWLERNEGIIATEETTRRFLSAEWKGVRSSMDDLGVEIVIPLRAKGRLIGFIGLAGKCDNDIYSSEDMYLLENLAGQTAIAVENARLYEDLKKQQAMTRRADRLAALGTLTAGLAHEIRNPLVAIKTLAQLLPERLDDEVFRRDFVDLAAGEVDRIASLVNELLDFARPREPKLQLEDIQAVIEGMLLLVSSEAKKKGIEIAGQYEENLPTVSMDPEQMKQVFLNILLNAIEATDEGGCVAVEVRTFRDEKEKEALLVEIRDTGRGIPEDNLENVFTPFFSTKDTGIGLGLSISHQIVEEHRGGITVSSRVGEGTSFFIRLPFLEEEREAKPIANKEPYPALLGSRKEAVA